MYLEREVFKTEIKNKVRDYHVYPREEDDEERLWLFWLESDIELFPQI